LQFWLCKALHKQNDRVVALPSSLVSELVQQMQVARAVWERDRQDGTPLMLPHQLARKYPECRFSWGWAWLFGEE
jgi:hypothetical protein